MRRLSPAVVLVLLTCLSARAETTTPLEGAPADPKIVFTTFFSEFLPAFRAIQDDFERDTGIAVEVQGVPYLSYQMWLHARFLGKNPPDVLLLENPGLAWRYGQAGLVVQFDDLIEQPNPLGEEARPWAEAFRKPYIQQSRDTDGHLYLIPYTQYGVGFFYNRSVYAELGLAPPRTWAGLLGNLDAVRESGRTAFITAIKPDDAQTVWMASMILECLMRVHVPEVNLRVTTPGWRFDPNDRQCTVPERIDVSERIVAFEKGIIDPQRAPEFGEVARIIKDMSTRWRPDFLSISGEKIYKEFAAAKTVHMMNGTWFLGEFDQLQEVMREVAPEKAFDHGVFPFPELGPETTLLARAGGINQNAGMRACLLVPVQKEAPWRQRAGVLFCQYVTLPQVARKLFEHTESCDIPALEAVPPKPKAESLLPESEYAFLPSANIAGYDAESLSEFWPLWQSYLGGTMELRPFLEKLSVSHRASLERQAQIYAGEVDAAFLDAQLGDGHGWDGR